MKYRNDLTAEFIRQILDYDPETGVLTWKPRVPDMFTDGGHSAEHTCSLWNSKHAGKKAGKKHKEGYIEIWVNRVPYKAHRLAWVWMTGEWPVEQVDHENLDRSHNKWTNLRDATHGENMRNVRTKEGSTSGHKNVTWSKSHRKWVVRVTFDGERNKVFEAADLELAALVASEVIDKYHGKFARSA